MPRLKFYPSFIRGDQLLLEGGTLSLCCDFTRHKLGWFVISWTLTNNKEVFPELVNAFSLEG